MDKKIARAVLEKFCSFPITSSEEVLKTFASLPHAVAHLDGEKNNFVYLPGSREDRVVLLAHADTVWDAYYFPYICQQSLKREKNVYYGADSHYGIGADDRAGCAILWLLKESGHSLLVVDGEEHGRIGSNYLRVKYPEIFNELNSHAYMIQFDRREHKNYKVYNLPVSDEFLAFIEENTGFKNAGKLSFTDIVTLCRDICGVNLSIGYYNEHTPCEKLNFDEWYETFEIAQKLLAKKQKRYPLEEI